MWYVHVAVADATYHKEEALTYSSPVKPEAGRVVAVALKRKYVLGIVVKVVQEPSFKTKEIAEMPDLPPLPQTSVQLLDWMGSYYPAPIGMTTQLFLPDSLTTQKTGKSKTDPAHQPQILPPLTRDQDSAIQAIHLPGMHILHGQTGSGKTRVYIELAKRTFNQGKSSIILTPEIGLTSQLAEDFRTVFGDSVLIVHSGLTNAQRRQAWLSILTSKKPTIVIGARSALFSPLRNVGLIVVDESHETSYKQDQTPYYHASTVAAKLASLHGAILVLGSATPLVSDYYIAHAKDRPVVTMTQVAAGSDHIETGVKVVDLTDKTQFDKSPHLSRVLLDAIRDRLQKHEQVLLFLNRRGTARVVFCEKCAWQATCPGCDLPLVYHGDSHLMRCHSCSHRARVPVSCPECKSAEIVFRSIGTKAITEEVERLFPEARVMRFDTDNKKSERLDAHYDKVKSGQVDIIVGTQTLAKGLDLPKLGLVGVIIADTGLYFPDFSAQERTYQLLSQVLGRVGRGHRQGQAIIQTYSPNSALLRAVLAKNWDIFYNNELKERHRFLFPPFCYLLKLSCKRATSKSAQQAAEKLRNDLKNISGIKIEGPAPAFHERSQNKFVWQLIVKAKRREHLTAMVKKLPSGWSHDIDPMNLL